MNKGRVIAIALLSCVASSCADTAAERQTRARIQPTYDKESGRLSKLEYDANNNGKTDTWAYMDGARLIRLEGDENEDGKIDRWEHYPTGPAGASARQPPERIERSTKFDGQISRREFFEGPLMVRVEEDTDANGTTDKWETYEAGVLQVMALDTTGDGKPDRRLRYRADGSLDYIEADPDGSGHFERVKQ